MDLRTYQQRARETARYPDVGRNTTYPTLGLCGEAGEVADKIKKVMRDRGGVIDAAVRDDLRLELGVVGALRAAAHGALGVLGMQ